jgi:hypothetical protein
VAYATGWVESAFGGEWNGRGPMAISEIAESPPRWEMCAALDGDSESASNVRTVHFPVPVWLDARPKGDACMCEALRSVKGIVERWTSEYRRGLPPTVVISRMAKRRTVPPWRPARRWRWQREVWC